MWKEKRGWEGRGEGVEVGGRNCGSGEVVIVGEEEEFRCGLGYGLSVDGIGSRFRVDVRA